MFETPTRRQFLIGAGTGALALGATRTTRGARPEKIRLGVIGCGGRGNWLAGLFRKHGGFEIAAAADVFTDRVEAFGDKYGVPAGRRFSGLAGYRDLLEHVQAVAIETPPYFHPEQAAAAVEAGCHIYLAKPVAVDVPGCQSIAASGASATAAKRCFIVDFQTRADRFYLEALRRVHAGAIGTFAFGEASYHAGNPFTYWYPRLQKEPASAELRLRAWGLDRILSGDIIVEQNIHTLDVASWILGHEPAWAAGTGGLTARPKIGTCWDHFAVLFNYPDDIGITFSSRQFEGHASAGGIRNRMFGSRGVLETRYGGEVTIRGAEPYPGGKSPGIFQGGAVANIATFHADITAGRCDNPTVAPSVRSNLLSILGRTAAYAGRRVTWEELLRDGERWKADLEGLR